MAKRIITVAALWASLWFAGGCAGPYTTFTQAQRQELATDLAQVQFYISHRVELNRTTASETRGVGQYRRTLEVVRRERVERIIIDDHTPGALQRVEGDTLFVQFEPPPGDVQRALPFRATQLYPEGGDADTMVFVFDPAQITYDGQVYDVLYAEENAPVTSVDGAVYADKAQSADTVQYIVQRRYPFLLINPFKETRWLKKDKRYLPGLHPAPR